MRIACVLLLAVLSLSACRKPSMGPCDTTQSLYGQYPFPIGVALNPNELQVGSPYETLATQQFNSITPEFSFKANYLHPEPDAYDWAAADELVAYCQATNKRLHGHTLIWHQALPRWLQEYSGSQAQWEELFRDHIQTICRHFRGQATSWDVVNEAFEADGTLRRTIWLEHLGSGYLEKAFRYAHEADPAALLFYNDYDLESNPVKRRAVLSWLQTMRQRGVPIHGLGLQLHISVQHPENTQIAQALRELQPTNLRLHLSEVDVSTNPLGQAAEPTPELLQRQAEKLAFVVRTYQQLPAAQRYGITFWGVSDQNSWLRSYHHRPDYPLLFDDSYLPKPAYCLLIRP